MNITFLIGNGFDVGLDLNTRYSDFYKTLKADSQNKIESDIVKKINSDDKNDELFWKDYELGLGMILKDVTTDEAKTQFKKDKKDLDQRIIKHIKSEEQRYTQKIIDKNAIKFFDNLKTFYMELNHSDRQAIFQKLSGQKSITYDFISFNYTSIFDKYISAINNRPKNVEDKTEYTLNNPLHIHGEYKSGYIIGLDNANQIKNQSLANDSYFCDYMLKKNINRYIGERRTERAEAIIKSSDIICVFGMSFGETDHSWWHLIKEMLRTTNKTLIIYDYDRNAELFSGSEIADYVINVRHRFLAASLCTDSSSIKTVFPKILVIHNSKIFDFKLPKEKQNNE